MRRLIKRTAELLLVRSGALRAVLALRRPPSVVLAYHNVVDAGDGPAGDAPLHLPRDRFAAQIDRLTGTHDVVPLGELRREGSSAPGRPRAAVTFDDAYRGCLTHGLEELRRRGLPATVFASPGLLGARAFWWDALADPDDGRLRPAVRRRALEGHDGEPEAVRRWARETGLRWREPPRSSRPATPDELSEALEYPGLEVGAHGWSHASLPRLEGEARRRQLERPLRWLRDRHRDSAVPWLAYPYGEGGPGVARLAEEVGYEGAVRLGGEPVGDGREFSLPRVPVPRGVSVEGFALRAAGLVRP